MSPDVEPVRCSCGATLLDGIDDSHVTVGDDEFRFRRTTDYVGCAQCGTMYRVSDLKPGLNQGIDGVTAEAIEDPLEELRKLALELEAAERAAAELRGDPPAGDDELLDHQLLDDQVLDPDA